MFSGLWDTNITAEDSIAVVLTLQVLPFSLTSQGPESDHSIPLDSIGR